MGPKKNPEVYVIMTYDHHILHLKYIVYTQTHRPREI